MANGLTKTYHSVHSLSYHFVQCVNNQNTLFENIKIIDLLKTQIYSISEKSDVEVIEIETGKDYFHVVFKSKPTLDITKYINAIKCITSREINRNFPKLKESLWTPSYFLATSGQVTIETLNNYINSQRKLK